MIHSDAPVRLEAHLKVAGQATYEGEVRVEGLLHAALVTAPIARGRVAAIDAAGAREVPGLAAIVTHETALRLRPSAFRLPLQDDRVRFAGQPVAIVLAETLHAARLAAAAVRVAYEAEPPSVVLAEAAHSAVAPKENSASLLARDSLRGDPEAAIAAAPHVLRARYTTPTHNHHPMEPHAILAAWDADRLTIHTGSQAVFAHARMFARLFGIPLQNVQLTSRLLGGGFGAKGGAWAPEMALAAMTARQVGRPVRLELTRAQMFTLVGRRPQSVQDLTLAAGTDGRLAAVVHHSLGETSTYGEYADPNTALSRSLYACENVATTSRIAPLDVPQCNPMRAPGEGTGSFALESALDELAHELGLDPLELRLRNHAEHDPHTGRPWSSNGLRDCYRIAAEAFGWAQRPQAIGVQRQGRRLVGQGLAAAAYPVYRMASEAEVALGTDGRLTVRCGTQDMGTGTLTVIGQLAAAPLGLGLDRVDVEIGDSRLPEGPYSGGSMATASFTPAVEAAAFELARQVKALACADPQSPLHGLDPARLVLEDAHVRAPQTNRAEPLAALMSRAAQGLIAQARVDTDAPGSPSATHSANGYGAVFAEVCVDPELGEVRVTRLTAAYAAGRILNRRLARSQYIGGLVGGLGMALTEQVVMDPRLGRILGDNLSDYLVPTHADMPAFDIHMVEEDDPRLAGGVKGIGMLGTVGVAAAVANAVFHATGIRVRDLPIRLERILGPDAVRPPAGAWR